MEDRDLVRIEKAIDNLQAQYNTLQSNQYSFQSEVIGKLNILLDTKIDKSLIPIQSDIVELKKDINAIKQGTNESLMWNYRQVIVIIVGFLLSGGAIGILEFILGLKK